MTDIRTHKMRRPTRCGWWSCREQSYAGKGAMCPHCRRPKSGPPEERSK